MMKRVLALVLSAVLCVGVLAGCGKGDDTKKEPSKVLTCGLESDIDNFDPFTGINAIITSIRQPITKPKTIDIKEDEIDLTESFFHVFMNHVVLSSLIAFLDDKMIYVKKPAIKTN